MYLNNSVYHHLTPFKQLFEENNINIGTLFWSINIAAIKTSTVIHTHVIKEAFTKNTQIEYCESRLNKLYCP